MGLIILCFIVPIIIAIIIAIKDRDGEFVFCGIFGGLLIGLIGTLIAATGGFLLEKDKVYNTETINICAFNDLNNTQENYFLGYNIAESKMYYCHLEDKNIDTLDIHNVKVYDNEKEAPRIVIEYKTNSNPFATFFFLPFKTSTSVYIPEGTIKYNYNIDLE